MKKNYLPILLLVGAGVVAYMLLRKRKEDETLPGGADQEPTVTNPEVSTLATSIAAGLKKALQAPKEGGAVKSTVAAAIKAIKEKQAKTKKAKEAVKAAGKALSKGIRIKGFNDNSVLV